MTVDWRSQGIGGRVIITSVNQTLEVIMATESKRREIDISPEQIMLPPQMPIGNMRAKQEVPIGVIKVNEQVRKERDPEKQARLNESVKLHGILQPLVVVPENEGFRLLAGDERQL
jgi:hypothetical protein